MYIIINVYYNKCIGNKIEDGTPLMPNCFNDVIF